MKSTSSRTPFPLLFLPEDRNVCCCPDCLDPIGVCAPVCLMGQTPPIKSDRYTLTPIYGEQAEGIEAEAKDLTGLMYAFLIWVAIALIVCVIVGAVVLTVLSIRPHSHT